MLIPLYRINRIINDFTVPEIRPDYTRHRHYDITIDRITNDDLRPHEAKKSPLLVEASEESDKNMQHSRHPALPLDSSKGRKGKKALSVLMVPETIINNLL